MGNQCFKLPATALHPVQLIDTDGSGTLEPAELRAVFTVGGQTGLLATTWAGLLALCQRAS